ncbi:MAG: glycosyltransferase family 4 protein [Halioglobus sp.]|nr:glycosyltransferase family 4 protein [Halioglobus sp.]
MIRINIIAWHNGGGLSRDVEILVNALPTDEFELALNGSPMNNATIYRRRIYHRVANIRQLSLKRSKLATSCFDINLFLEDVVPGFFPFAKHNAFIPNPEWFKKNQTRHLKKIDAVFCKTQHAQKVFSAIHHHTRFISFTSADRLDHTATDKARKQFLHLAGRSWQKGTDALTNLWLAHPEWPVLRVVQSPRTYKQSRVIPKRAPNIDHIVARLKDAELRSLQNTHAMHLCPSEAEGFGHVIAEAMSCGAVTLTTNAPPMNELINEERGFLVDYDRSRAQRAGRNYFVSSSDLKSKVISMLDLPDDTTRLISQNARAWFEDNDRQFRQLLYSALFELARIR